MSYQEPKVWSNLSFFQVCVYLCLSLCLLVGPIDIRLSVLFWGCVKGQGAIRNVVLKF